MIYKIEILKVGGDKSVDIPKGCIPIKYDCSIERRDPLVSLIRTLTILRPIENIEDNQYLEEEIEDKCFFCEKIRPICPICLGELYGLAKESHKSQEC